MRPSTRLFAFYNPPAPLAFGAYTPPRSLEDLDALGHELCSLDGSLTAGMYVGLSPSTRSECAVQRRTVLERMGVINACPDVRRLLEAEKGAVAQRMLGDARIGTPGPAVLAAEDALLEAVRVGDVAAGERGLVALLRERALEGKTRRIAGHELILERVRREVRDGRGRACASVSGDRLSRPVQGLTVRSVLGAAIRLLDREFDVQIVPSLTLGSGGECPGGGAGSGGGVAAPAAGVELMEARRGGKALGLLYLDLLAREGKPPGTAHATLRTNRHGREVLPEGLIMTAMDAGDCMSPREASSFFHELGHFLHIALSETWYAEAAGTRAPIELVEVPSTFLERCFFTKDVLADCGVPRRACDEIIDLEQATRPAKALELARNTLVDMELHRSESLARDPVGFIADIFGVPRRRAAAFAMASTHFVYYPNLVGTYYLADRAVEQYQRESAARGFRALEEDILRNGIEKPGFSLDRTVQQWLGNE